MSNEPQTTLAERWAKAGRLKKMLPELQEEVTVRRLSKEALIMSPRLPGSLTTKVVKYFRELEGLADGDTSDPTLQSVSIEQLARMPEVVNAVLIHTLESPRAVLEGADPKKNQINVADIPDLDRMFLFAGAMADWPEMPVATEGGEVSINDLASFHPGRPGGDADSGGAGVGDEGVGAARAA